MNGSIKSSMISLISDLENQMTTTDGEEKVTGREDSKVAKLTKNKRIK